MNEPLDEPRATPTALPVAWFLLRADSRRVLLGLGLTLDILLVLLVSITGWVPDTHGRAALFLLGLGTTLYVAFHLDGAWTRALRRLAGPALVRAAGLDEGAGLPHLTRGPVTSGRDGGSLPTPLSPSREAMWQRIDASSRRIEELVAHLPHEGLAGLSSVLSGQQKGLVPDLQAALRFADWLSARAEDLDTRAGHYADPGGLAEVRTRIDEIDRRAAQSAEILESCEARVLAMVSKRAMADDIPRLLDEIAEIFEEQHRIVQALSTE